MSSNSYYSIGFLFSIFFVALVVFVNGTVIEIEFMTLCMTRHDAWIYNGYGCYCGIGGSGEVLDEVDQCCANHDECYNQLYLNNTCWNVPLEYLPVYTWKCDNRNVQCTGLSTFGYQILPHDCGSGLCDCDRKLVECWAKYPEPKVQLKCPHPRTT